VKTSDLKFLSQKNQTAVLFNHLDKKEVKMKNVLRLIALLLIVFFGLVSLGPSTANSADEWYLPAITQLTGTYSAWCEQGVWAYKFLVDEINAKGGVLGKPIRLEVFDEGPDASVTVPVMAKVIDKKPLCILGPVDSNNVKASVPLAIKEGIFTLPATAGVGSLVDFLEPKSWVISHLDTDERTAKPGAIEWAKQNPDIKKVVMFLFPEHQLYINYAKYQTEGLEEMGVEVKTIEVTEEVNLGPIATKALAYKPDGFVMSVLANACAKLIIELDKRGVKDKRRILMFGSADDPELYAIGKGYLDGAYMWTYFNQFYEGEEWQRLLKAYQAAHPDKPEPNLALWMLYDEVKMVVKAIEDLKLTGDPAKLAEERAAIRDYCINQKGFPFVIPGPCDVINGIKQQTISFNKIENNKKVFIKYVRLD
jgi:branched-chain amino acid transport system substrate-binding protein